LSGAEDREQWTADYTDDTDQKGKTEQKETKQLAAAAAVKSHAETRRAQAQRKGNSSVARDREIMAQ
jgi:hypothetical protein